MTFPVWCLCPFQSEARVTRKCQYSAPRSSGPIHKESCRVEIMECAPHTSDELWVAAVLARLCSIVWMCWAWFGSPRDHGRQHALNRCAFDDVRNLFAAAHQPQVLKAPLRVGKHVKVEFDLLRAGATDFNALAKAPAGDIERSAILRKIRRGLRFNAAMDRPAASTTPSSQMFEWLRRRYIWRSLFNRCSGEETLVGHGCEHGDHRHADQRADAIQLIQLREIVEKEF